MLKVSVKVFRRNFRSIKAADFFNRADGEGIVLRKIDS